MKKAFVIFTLLFFSCFMMFASSDIAPPEVKSVERGSDDEKKMYVYFDFETASGKGEKAIVKLYDKEMKELDSKTVGKSKKNEKKTYFKPSKSGTYYIEVIGIKGGEEYPSTLFSVNWSYPLATPEVSLINEGNETIKVQWNSVNEAEEYSVTINGTEYKTKETEMVFTDLIEGEKYSFSVSAFRDGERSEAPVVYKTARKEKDRVWNFTRFGQSTKEALNTYNIIDSDELELELNSCSVTLSGDVSEKGGKYTSLHDGISYYYTVIDPKSENFSLSATFVVDFINPTPDGQEGFGIIAMDSLGEDGVSSSNHYTNSASLIAFKYEGWINGVKYSSKDTLGSRFITGITKESIERGEEAITESAVSLSEAYSYDKEDLVKKGNEYRLTLSLDNTGFHCVLNGEDHILYMGREELTVIDEDHIYVGFSVARGCNVRVKDVVLTTSDPALGPVGVSKPKDIIPYEVKIESPSTWAEGPYLFTLHSNSDGRTEVIDKRDGTILLSSFPVKKGVDTSGYITLGDGVTPISVIFTPDKSTNDGEVSYGIWNEKGRLEESLEPIVIGLDIEKKSFDRKTLYVSPSGNSDGDGTKENPLDIYSAIKFSKPGTEIILEDGMYDINERLRIERGNSGTKGEYKTLRGEGNVVLDFSHSSYGMELWGDYWILSNFTIRNTIDGKKGLQIAGDHNIVEFITAEFCGDTGIQISGSSQDSKDKWPKDNLVQYCISHDNSDSAMNNADGFAAKLTVGEGNRFLGCASYNNADDGWDLFSKIETGAIGKVRVEKCIAFSNGVLSDGRSGGDGNGFKLGGDGIGVNHELVDSIAFNNLSNGVTSNSNPKCIVINVISWNNWGVNITLYGKGSGERNFVLENVISLHGGSSDNIAEEESLYKENTYLWDGERSSNSKGRVVDDSVFLSTTFSCFEMRENGIDMGDFLRLKTEFDFSVSLRKNI